MLAVFFSLACTAQVIPEDDHTPVQPPAPPVEIGAPEILVEEVPSFPGGTEAMNKFIRDRMRFPYAEYEKGLSGTCFVNFIVEKDGSITNIQLLKGVPDAPGFSTESIRLMNSLPKFMPGRHNGKPVSSAFTFPVRFTNTIEYSAEKIKTAKAYNTAGEEYLSKRDYEQALQKFEEVLKIFPNDRDALFGKAETLSQLHRTGEASELMQKIERGVPFTNKALKKKRK